MQLFLNDSIFFLCAKQGKLFLQIQLCETLAV